jgi:hypothetical protein
MKEHGILFSAPMVKAILDGRKTQTRRILSPHVTWAMAVPHVERWTLAANRWHRLVTTHDGEQRDNVGEIYPEPYTVGDRLWVREAWRTARALDKSNAKHIEKSCRDAGYEKPWTPTLYLADDMRRDWNVADGEVGRYRHARFMPRWASRLTLEVTALRVERLQQIDDDDAAAEGVGLVLADDMGDKRDAMTEALKRSRVDGYRLLWDSINDDGTDPPETFCGKAWARNPPVRVISFRVVRT